MQRPLGQMATAPPRVTHVLTHRWAYATLVGHSRETWILFLIHLYDDICIIFLYYARLLTATVLEVASSQVSAKCLASLERMEQGRYEKNMKMKKGNGSVDILLKLLEDDVVVLLFNGYGG